MSSPVEQALDMSNAEATRALGDNLNNHVLEIFSYALYTMIFVVTLCQIASRGEWPPQRVALTAVICVIWSLATIHVGFDWNALYSVFVTHGQSRDSVLANTFGLGDENWSTRRLAINIVGTTTMATNAMLAELTNIWRCWELYNRNWLLVSILLAALMSGLVSHALNMVATYPSGSMSVGTSITQVNWSIVYYSITASINLLTTSLIVLRILSVAGLKSLRTYRGLIGILVESAFIYSATYLINLALYLRDFYLPEWSFTYWYPAAFLNAVTAAAPTMIIGRVMSGEAHPNDSWTRSSLPHMGTTMRDAGSIRFASFGPQTTNAGASEIGNVSDTARPGVETGGLVLPLHQQEAFEVGSQASRKGDV